MVLHVKLQPQRTKPVEMRAKSVLQLKIMFVFNAFFALSLFLDISKPVENHISKSYLNNFHQHRSKWPDFSEKKRPSMIRFDKK